ncbi:hypothetical protein GJ744_005232 [Endocarpon pusillum]|uniref:Uncharacterized protein n=1 Tax=Endocarpon pusillum TaxID=364733 RepID=A0A8H7A7C8_9EURO|nr:hypothetical protein GJ744_005232 [Endocarpon pusillum]
MPPVRKSRFTDDERRLRKNQRERKRRAQRKDGGEPDFIRMVKATDIPPTKPRRQAVAYSDKIVHEKGQDCEFRSEVLIQLEGTLRTRNPKSWGFITASAVKKDLTSANPPITNLEPGISSEDTQALFLDTDSAQRLLSSNETLRTPVFTVNQQPFSWSLNARPIIQLLQSHINGDKEIDVNIASLTGTQSFARKTIAELQSRFMENKDHNDPWNVLDFECPLPENYGVCPKFLQNSNCGLLNQIKRMSLEKGSACRPITTPSILSGVMWNNGRFLQKVELLQRLIKIVMVTRPSSQSMKDRSASAG